MVCPMGIKVVFSAISCHVSGRLILRIALNFSALCGKKGSQIEERAAAICRAICIMVGTRSGASLMRFQGSSSARYLFPNLARFNSS